MIALGLVAGALAAGREPDPEELLCEGVELEGHPDNLAAALAGGVCLTWENRVVQVADSLPAVPIAVIPKSTVSTSEARAALPASVSHEDATFTACRAALLGAAVACGSGELFAAALHDRLHQPYREPRVPALAAVRDRPPVGALGATISGSGPTAIVWARPEAAAACAGELTGRFPDTTVRQLGVSPRGAVHEGVRNS